MTNIEGYGRYESDPDYVGCPRAQSDMTPCIARDGRTALADEPVSCVGCDARPSKLLSELTEATGTQDTLRGAPKELADRLTALVRVVTDPK